MDSETLNDYLFADLVTRWAAHIAQGRDESHVGNAPSSGADLSVTTEDLRIALAQLELRRGVVRALREAAPAASRGP